MYSSPLARYYDFFISEHDTFTTLLKKLIGDCAPRSNALLEVGCGTGSILESFTTSHQLSGLDISPFMIAESMRKVPSAEYYCGDMRSFALDQHYDVILCIRDTINHLLTLSDWKRFFRCVQRHLSSGGVFIFDTNTLARLELYAQQPPFIQRVGQQTLLCARVTKTRKDIYNVQIQLFENIGKKKITYYEDIIPERAFPLEMIRNTVAHYFLIEKIVDRDGQIIKEDSGRVFFVCRPKNQ